MASCISFLLVSHLGYEEGTTPLRRGTLDRHRRQARQRSTGRNSLWTFHVAYRDGGDRLGRQFSESSWQRGVGNCAYTAAAVSSPCRNEYTVIPPACFVDRSLNSCETSPKAIIR